MKRMFRAAQVVEAGREGVLITKPSDQVDELAVEDECHAVKTEQTKIIWTTKYFFVAVLITVIPIFCICLISALLLMEAYCRKSLWVQTIKHC